MALLPILRYPDPRLKMVSRPVSLIDEGIGRLIEDMIETMYAANGAGLAAPQVGSLVRLAVIDVSDRDEERELYILINPVIVEREGEMFFEEGCLSLPGVSEEIKRSQRVVVEALDREGNPQRIEATGLLAVALQHEIDHLNGTLIVDYVNPLKRRLIRRKMLRLPSGDEETSSSSETALVT